MVPMDVERLRYVNKSNYYISGTIKRMFVKHKLELNGA